jgi:hypothetical protein
MLNLQRLAKPLLINSQKSKLNALNYTFEPRAFFFCQYIYTEEVMCNICSVSLTCVDRTKLFFDLVK